MHSILAASLQSWVLRKKKVPQQSLTRLGQDWQFLAPLDTPVYFLTPVLVLLAQEGMAKGGREERKQQRQDDLKNLDFQDLGQSFVVNLKILTVLFPGC